MAKKTDTKIAPKKYSVIKMACDNCGEEVYYILTCHHCGGDLAFKEAMELTQAEIKNLIENDEADFKGDLKKVLISDDETDDDVEGIGNIGTLEEEELDDLYSSGPFSPL
jgi:hypothetical protein